MLEVVVIYLQRSGCVALNESLYSFGAQPKGIEHLALVLTELDRKLMLHWVLVSEPEAVALSL